MTLLSPGWAQQKLFCLANVKNVKTERTMREGWLRRMVREDELRLRVVIRASSSCGRYNIENPVMAAFIVDIFSVSINCK